MGQVKTKTVTFKTVMRSAAFVRGVREAHAGIPMDYEAYTNERLTDNRWNYERGRLFGMTYPDDVKYKGRVRRDAYAGTRSRLCETRSGKAQ
jgi:hypothetical protein